MCIWVLSLSLNGLIIGFLPFDSGLSPELILFQTPIELRQATRQSEIKPVERNWADLKISDNEIRILEKIEDQPDFEAFNIAYRSEGLHITGVLARPKLKQGVRYPLIMLNHGAMSGVNAVFRAIAWALARRDYVVLASTYRGETNAEGRSEGKIEMAKGEVLDVLHLTRLGKQLPYVGPGRIGIMGQSHGGSITISAIQRSDDFQAAISIVPGIFSGSRQDDQGGLDLLRRMLPQFYGKGLSEKELRDELQARDMYLKIDKIRTPLLLITTDGDFGYQGQKHFAEHLKNRGVDHHFLVYPGLFHTFMTAPDRENPPAHWEKSRNEAWKEVFDFLGKHLHGKL